MEWTRSHAEKTNCCREKNNKQVENVNIHKIYMRVCVCVLAIHSTTTTSTIWCDHSRNPAFNNKTSFMRDILNTSTQTRTHIHAAWVVWWFLAHSFIERSQFSFDTCRSHRVDALFVWLFFFFTVNFVFSVITVFHRVVLFANKHIQLPECEWEEGQV